MATSVLTLEQLPEDVVVIVLQYLPVKDVLDCRLVCKRLCGLALDWDVWRHRSLKDDDFYAGAVLHLAPCLDTLIVTGKVPTLAVTTTRCAVASLELVSDYYPSINAAEYALALRNQELLGRLRKLELKTNFRPASDVLIRAVGMCSNLESLEIFDDLPDFNHTVVHGPPRPSLTNFGCSVDENSASFVNTILTAHAATLEQVSISARDDFAETRTAELLVIMPRLRILRCDTSLCGLNVLAECKTLRDVSIHHVKLELEKIDVLSDFLRRANQLRRVHLDCSLVDEDSHPEVGAVLVRALTWSGRSYSHLEWLALEGVTDVRPLLRALPSLPALRHLDLDAEPDDELLMSITPVAAPALRSLGVVAEEACPHAWIHGAAVKATLAENPSLHIQLWCPRLHLLCPPGRKCRTQDCEACVTGCHREVKWGDMEKIGLYSHDPDKCPSPEEHTDATNWQGSHHPRYDVACTCTWYHI